MPREFITYWHDSDTWYKTYALIDNNWKTYKTWIHRLVYCVFNWIDFKKYNPYEKTLVCHKNDIKTDNSLDNLFLWDARDNFYDCYNKWRWWKFIFEAKKWELNNFSKLNTTQVKLIKKLLLENKQTHQEISNLFWVSRSCITNINTKDTWQHININ